MALARLEQGGTVTFLFPILNFFYQTAKWVGITTAGGALIAAAAARARQVKEQNWFLFKLGRFLNFLGRLVPDIRHEKLATLPGLRGTTSLGATRTLVRTLGVLEVTATLALAQARNGDAQILAKLLGP